jgi:hypothetical protein
MGKKMMHLAIDDCKQKSILGKAKIQIKCVENIEKYFYTDLFITNNSELKDLM